MKEAGVTPRKFMFGVMPGKRFIMAQQIVSLKHKTGTYEGNAYDNYMRSLYFSFEALGLPAPMDKKGEKKLRNNLRNR